MVEYLGLGLSCWVRWKAIQFNVALNVDERFVVLNTDTDKSDLMKRDVVDTRVSDLFLVISL